MHVGYNDFKNKMIELLKDDNWENIEYVKALFISWVLINNFNPEDEIIEKMANEVAEGCGFDTEEAANELFAELESVLIQ